MLIRSLAATVIVATSCLAQPATQDPPGAWNQWRGPERSGHCGGPTWPKRLTEKNFRQQWRVPLGPSYSGPIVDRERVYVTETLDKKDEIVRALDRRTGKELWKKQWAGSMEVPFFAARNGSWIRATPALDGDSLYVAGMRDVLVCLDKKTGKERWRVDFVERFNTPLPDFGFVSSPLVLGDHVYVQAGASFVKLHKRTGETVWRSLADAGGMYGSAFSSPVAATIRGRKQLLVQTRESLNGVDLESGEKLWGIPVRSFRGMNILTPLPYREGVFTSAYGGRSHYFVVEEKDGIFSVDEKWKGRSQANMTSPVLIDGHAYLYLRSERFTCVNLETGKATFLTDPIGDTYWSIVAQGRRILALTDGGELYLIAATPERFEVVDRLRIAESSTWAHLAVDRRQIFVRELDGVAAHAWTPRARRILR